MEDLFENATINGSNINQSSEIKEDELESKQEIEQKDSKKSKIAAWFTKNKLFLIAIALLVAALIVVSVVLYFKNSSIGSMISCKEEMIEGLNREITKSKLQISKLEIKNEELEKMNKELQKKSISDYNKEKQEMKKKMNTKPNSEKSDKNKSDEIDALVFNGTRTQSSKDTTHDEQTDDDLEALPINL